METRNRARVVCRTLILLGFAALSAEEHPPILEEILAQGNQLRSMAFADLVKAATGKRVLPFDARNSVHQRLLKAVERACESALILANERGGAFAKVDRINEMSRLFENEIQRFLDAQPGFSCDFPKNIRSGYPDMCLTDKASGVSFYLDPKLYQSDSEDSSFRTFYYEPDGAAKKIDRDAVHLILGFAHNGDTGHWKFTSWKIVNLSGLKVRLKAEFQASNRDLYAPDAVLVTSGPPTSGAKSGD